MNINTNWTPAILAESTGVSPVRKTSNKSEIFSQDLERGC